MIKPKGFFLDYLKLQMDGLTGHMEEAGYPFNQVQWGEPDFETDNAMRNWWVYEQTAYHLDGYLKASILLGIEENIKKVECIVDKVISNPDYDDYLGPRNIRKPFPLRWPHVVFFRMCLVLYEYNHNEKIIDAMVKHYLNSLYEWTPFRDICNVEILCKLYEITNNEELLTQAKRMYKTCNEIEASWINQITDQKVLKRGKLFCHGVTYNEFMKLGAILYKYTKDPYYLNISEKAYHKLVTYYMLPGGLHSSAEQTRSNYYMECYETCDISDYTWSLSYLEQISKKHTYGDAVERCIFNAGIGSILEDFKGLQYFSCANQLILDTKSNHSPFSKGMKWMSYRPNPGTECCPGNANRFMPNYISNMIKEEETSTYIYLFGACSYSDHNMDIEEETTFPFGNSFLLHIKPKRKSKLYIRKIGYAISLSISGSYKENKDFFIFDIEGDMDIAYSYTDEIKVNICNKKGIYLTKGLFTYSYGEYGKREIDLEEERSSKDFPAYNIYPLNSWGFEAKIEDLNPKYFEFIPKRFSLLDSMPYIEVTLYPIENPGFFKQKQILRVYHDLDGTKTSRMDKGDYTFTPDLLKGSYTTKESKRVKLYPYAACKIRETVFKIKK